MNDAEVKDLAKRIFVATLPCWRTEEHYQNENDAGHVLTVDHTPDVTTDGGRELDAAKWAIEAAEAFVMVWDTSRRAKTNGSGDAAP